MKFFEKAKQFDIILGSNSPRRKQLLLESGIPFRVMPNNSNENFPENLSPSEIVTYLSKNKAKSYKEELKKTGVIVITADTIVVNGSQILNKPADKKEAIKMLQNLSGNTHEVITGVTISTINSEQSFYDKTLVSFATLDDEEILHYIESCKPFDKAGSYGIQEWIGIIGIEKISGSFHNVVGLPVHKVYSVIKSIVSA
ncbi:MAG: Maf family nucleotide pyrophosphatase [Bacteroidales bacterium]